LPVVFHRNNFFDEILAVDFYQKTNCFVTKTNCFIS